MLNNLKALLVVLFLATSVFMIVKPIALRFMAEADFARRRNLWLVLTATAFASPNIWLFMLIAMPLLAWGSGKDGNPLAFYIVFMNIVPPTINIQIPTAGTGINELFEMNGYRMLAFSVLFPAAWRLSSSSGKPGLGRLDFLLLAYIALQLILLMPHESITNTMRRGFLVISEVFLLYYVATRTCNNRRALIDAVASFCLICAVYAPVSQFETLKGWMLYGGLGSQWGDHIRFVYLFRADSLRAQVSAGNSIPFGYMMAIAFGFWLYLGSRASLKSRAFFYLGCGWMWIGLLAAYSRGPWLTAMVILFSYLALSPRGASKLIKAMLVAGIASGLLLVSPIGDRIIDNLPFVGTVDAENVSYRQQLLETSWRLILQHPFFGSPSFLAQMEHMRQGQGIIDLVNVYVVVALYYGLVGLAVFMSVFLGAMWKAYCRARSLASTDPELSLLGVNLLACMLGTLLMMGTAGLSPVMKNMFYLLASLAAAYAYMVLEPEDESTEAAAGAHDHAKSQPGAKTG